MSLHPYTTGELLGRIPDDDDDGGNAPLSAIHTLAFSKGSRYLASAGASKVLRCASTQSPSLQSPS